jgi:hypothetical protein
MATGIICIVTVISNCLLLMEVVTKCSTSNRKDGHRPTAQPNCMLVTVKRGIKKHSCEICMVNMKTNSQVYTMVLYWYFIFHPLSCFVTVAEKYRTAEKSAHLCCCKQCACLLTTMVVRCALCAAKIKCLKLWQQLYEYIVSGMRLLELDFWCSVREQKDLVISLQPSGVKDCMCVSESGTLVVCSNCKMWRTQRGNK